MTNYQIRLETQDVNTFSLDELKGAANQIHRNSTDFRNVVISELLLRYLISDFDNNFPLKDVIENICYKIGVDIDRFTGLDARVFLQTKNTEKISLKDFIFPKSSIAPEKYKAVNGLNAFFIKRVNEEVLSADGFIPVCSDEKSLIIPFKIELGETFGAIDKAGNEIPDWSNAVKLLCKILNTQFGVKIFSKFNVMPEGRSLMLPIAMAYFRKKGELPLYYIRRLFFTGEISENGSLVSVQVSAKKEYLKKTCPQACLVAPKSTVGEIETNDDYLQLLNPGVSIYEVKNFVKNLIELKYPGLIRFEEVDFCNNKESIERYVNKKCSKGWNNVIKILSKYEDSLDEDENPIQFVLLHIIKSDAYCHIGQTGKSEECLKYVRKIIADKGLPIDEIDENTLWQARFRSIINSLDKESFEYVENEFKDIDSLQINDEDILMRYEGCKYRFYMYKALLERNENYKTKSLDAAKKAIKYAGAVGDVAEIIRDYNYRHMWYAVFEPGTEKERKAYEKCINKCNELDEDLKTKNLSFLSMQRWFSIYRQILMNNQCEHIQETSIDDTCEFWLKALICKYKGAWFARQKQFDKSLKMFDVALKSLEDNDYEINDREILGYIKMTIYAEAYRSMISLGDEVKAMEFLEKAKQLVEKNKEEFETYPSFKFWKAYLENPTTTEFPGLKYWY